MSAADILKVKGTDIVDKHEKVVLLRGVCLCLSLVPFYYPISSLPPLICKPGWVGDNCANSPTIVWPRWMDEHGELHHRLPWTRIPNPRDPHKDYW